MYQNKNVRHRGTDGARVIQLIETKSLKGSGTDSDPLRATKQFWSFDGSLIAESDPFIDEEYESQSSPQTGAGTSDFERRWKR